MKGVFILQISQGETMEYKQKKYIVYKKDFLNLYMYDSDTLELFFVPNEFIEDYQNVPSEFINGDWEVNLPDPVKVQLNESIYLEYVSFLSSRPVGRPSIGVTKKVSITLPDDVWDLIDSRFDNRSAFFRNLVNKELINSKDNDLRND